MSNVDLDLVSPPGGRPLRARVIQRSLFATAQQREEAKGFGAVELGQQALQHLAGYLAQI